MSNCFLGAQLGQVFVPLNNTDGCLPFTEDMFTEDAQNALYHDYVAVELPVILIDRGNCTFVTKVRNVEKAGANAALIGDNEYERSETMILSDDGSGHSINIPSFLIRKKTSDHFKDYKDNGSRLIVKIGIETALTNNTVTVDLWYSSEFDLTEGILSGFKKIIPKFEDKVIFNPRIKTKSCSYCSREE